MASLSSQISELTSKLTTSDLYSSVSYADIVGQPSPSMNEFTATLNYEHKQLSVKNPVIPNNPEHKFRFVIVSRSKKDLDIQDYFRDSNNVADVITKLDNSIPALSIQDCTRLGKFSEGIC